MNVDLIHIGLIKTASTALQNTWRQNPSVNLSYAGLLPFINAARILGKGQVSNLGNININCDKPMQAKQKTILTHEALSTAYFNERASKALIRNFQLTAAKLLGQISSQAKVLIVVRNPAKWIISTYNQCIKQGGTDTFPQFLIRERGFITQ